MGVPIVRVRARPGRRPRRQAPGACCGIASAGGRCSVFCSFPPSVVLVSGMRKRMGRVRARAVGQREEKDSGTDKGSAVLGQVHVEPFPGKLGFISVKVYGASESHGKATAVLKQQGWKVLGHREDKCKESGCPGCRERKASPTLGGSEWWPLGMSCRGPGGPGAPVCFLEMAFDGTGTGRPFGGKLRLAGRKGGLAEWEPHLCGWVEKAMVVSPVQRSGFWGMSWSCGSPRQREMGKGPSRTRA